MRENDEHGLNQPWRSDIRMSTEVLHNGQEAKEQRAIESIAAGSQ